MAQNTVANADKKDVALELHQYVHSAMQTITNAERKEAETLLEKIDCSIERSRTECTATRGILGHVQWLLSDENISQIILAFLYQ